MEDNKFNVLKNFIEKIVFVLKAFSVFDVSALRQERPCTKDRKKSPKDQCQRSVQSSRTNEDVTDFNTTKNIRVGCPLRSQTNCYSYASGWKHLKGVTRTQFLKSLRTNFVKTLKRNECFELRPKMFANKSRNDLYMMC